MQNTIHIKTTQPLPDSEHKVIVEGNTTTEHTVTLHEEYYQKLTMGTMPPEELIQKSFEFLLEREPNTSILRTFDLEVISTYFPEYEENISANT